MADPQLIYTTWPDAGTAEVAARALLEARLIACANILASGRSLYRWNGAIQGDPETVMILKTTSAHIVAVRDRITALHPYDTPCILVLPVDGAAGHPGFAAWIDRETASDDV